VPKGDAEAIGGSAQTLGITTRGMRTNKTAGAAMPIVCELITRGRKAPLVFRSIKKAVSVNDRITFRLGTLAEPLAAYCEKHGTTPSEAIRLALSRLLRVEAPEMPPGNPAIGEQAEAGAAARWKPKKKRRK
jgi:hypothetical protein